MTLGTVYFGLLIGIPLLWVVYRAILAINENIKNDRRWNSDAAPGAIFVDFLIIATVLCAAFGLIYLTAYIYTNHMETPILSH